MDAFLHKKEKIFFFSFYYFLLQSAYRSLFNLSF